MVSIELDITFFIQAGLFLMLIYIMNVLIYRPVLNILRERSRKLDDLAGDVLSAEKEIEEKLAAYQARISEAKSEGNLLRAEIKKEGLQKEAEMLSEAQKEAHDMIESARIKIGNEMEAALKGIAGVTEEMSRGICEKVVGRSA